MEYISSEEFKKQDKEVQKIFLDWWEPSARDLIETKVGFNIIKDIVGTHVRDLSSNVWSKNNMIPLLTEGQLRKFIEDMSHCNMLILWNTYYGDIYQHKVCFSKKSHFNKIDLKRCTNLLEAYWLAALEIAKEKVKA